MTAQAPVRAVPAAIETSRTPVPPARSGRALAAPTPRPRWIVIVAGALITVGAGVGLGMVTTDAALRHGERVGEAALGLWRMHPGEGTPGINPYQRAAFARSGAVPMSAGQGVLLRATRDPSGRRFDRRCTYTLVGPVPRAGFWTLGAVDADGRPFATDMRAAYTSEDILRDEAGGFTIILSPAPQPGNWLPLAGAGRFDLVLRLYDSVMPGLSRRELATVSVPSITAGPCGG